MAQNLLNHLIGMQSRALRIVRRPKRIEFTENLADIARGLTETMERAEPSFLAVGDELKSIKDDAERLAALTLSTARAARGCRSDDTCLLRIDGWVKTALDQLKTVRETIAGTLRTLRESVVHIDRLSAACPAMEQLSLALNIVGFTIAVESSRSDQARGLFDVFTEDIRMLSQKISQNAEAILTDCQNAKRQQQNATTRVSGELKSFESVFKDAAEVVLETVRKIQEVMSLSSDTFEKTNAHSLEIASQIDRVVVAGQFHDIARQKIDHIAAALMDVEKMASESGAGKPFSSAGAYQMMRLQEDQMEEVIRTIREAADINQKAFAQMTGRVKAMAGDRSDASSDEDDAGRVRDLIGRLHSGLTRLQDLIGRGKAMEHEVQESACRVSETADRLSAHITQVRGISREIHLNALNAIIKSTRLHSEGLALEVLAQEVSRLSGQTNQFVAGVVTEITSLMGLARQTDASCDSRDLAAETAAVENIREVTDLYQKALADARSAWELADTIRDRIVHMEGNLGIISDLAESLKEYLDRINRAAEGFRPLDDHPAPKKMDYLDQAASRYTMESEREIHSRHIDPAAPADSGKRSVRQVFPEKRLVTNGDGSDMKEKAPPSGENAGKELGENVELF